MARGCEAATLRDGKGELRTDIYFVFMNTPPLAEGLERRIIHVARTSDEPAKSRFIRTCDAMLHARSSGETFGLAVGEFSAHNRPVVTSSVHTDHGTARFHLDALGTKVESEYLLTHSLTHLLAYLLTHLLTHLLAYLLT